MAGTVEKNFEGTVAIGSANNPTDARQIIHREFTSTWHTLANENADQAIFEAQSPLILKAVRLVPAVPTTAHAANFITVTLSTGDQAAGALTALDAFDTNTAGANVSLVMRTAYPFTIVTTDTMDTGDTLYLEIVHTGGGAINGGLVIVEYELQG